LVFKNSWCAERAILSQDLSDGEPRNNGGSTARGGDVISNRGIKSRLQHCRAISTASRGATEQPSVENLYSFNWRWHAIDFAANKFRESEMIGRAIEIKGFDARVSRG